MVYEGYVDEINRFYVAGWVVDRSDWNRSVEVDILVNGCGQGVCTAGEFRETLDRLDPHATGRYAFRYYFADPLSMYSEQVVSVRVSDTDYHLIQNRRLIRPIAGGESAAAHRPAGPVLLSTIGRTGSTAVMALLAQHPNIVVAGHRPYEVEMGCYYSYALRTLLAAGDHERSLRTDNITAAANRFSIGFNPYFKPSFGGVFKDATKLESFLADRLPGRIGRAFRDIILDYYEEVAFDQGIERPLYFAEKSLPERDARLGIRFMFPQVKEVVLVRDLRDVVCSSYTSNGLPFDRVVEDTAAAAKQLSIIVAEADASILVLKYEDIVQKRLQTIRRLFKFLTLSSIKEDERLMNDLFANHATSADPAASIGRWKKELTTEQKRMCEVFGPTLDRFGYCD